MDEFIIILNFLGKPFVIILVSTIVIFSLYKWYRGGLKISDYTIFKGSEGIDIPKKILEFFELAEYQEIEVEGLKHGFFVPPSEIKIYGKLWNSSDEIHAKVFSKLERDWTNQRIIDLRDANTASTLLSLIEDKYMELGRMTIICSKDQEEYLKRYFNQFENMFIKSK